MQNSTFSNFDVVHLAWTLDALFIADGLTFSNITTNSAQWDSSGGVVRGDGDAWVYDFQDEMVPPSVPSTSLSSRHVPRLTAEDVWFKEVQAVCIRPRLTALCFLDGVSMQWPVLHLPWLRKNRPLA